MHTMRVRRTGKFSCSFIIRHVIKDLVRINCTMINLTRGNLSRIFCQIKLILIPVLGIEDGLRHIENEELKKLFEV